MECVRLFEEILTHFKAEEGAILFVLQLTTTLKGTKFTKKTAVGFMSIGLKAWRDK